MDEFTELTTTPENVAKITRSLIDHHQAICGWSDEDGSRFDLWFAVKIPHLGPGLTRGLRPKTDLFIAVIGHGAHGFRTDIHDTVANYYAEKLKTGSGVSSTEKKLAEFFNAIRKSLAESTEIEF